MMDELEIRFRDAVPADIRTIVGLLANDPLGKFREDTSDDRIQPYLAAFEAILNDVNHTIVVAEVDTVVAGVLQLSFLPHLTYEGGWRAQIEGVRVAESLRSRGVGQALVMYAIERAREKGCHLVQLTTDRRRPDALRFYKSLGFAATHEGMKLHLDRNDQ